MPKGEKLVTLRDAALHITKLPKAEHDAKEWQAAMEAATPKLPKISTTFEETC